MKKNEGKGNINSASVMVSNLAGNFVSESAYGLYEKWFDYDEWLIWSMKTISNLLYPNRLNDLRRAGLKARCRAIVIRDRTETEVFNGYNKLE